MSQRTDTVRSISLIVGSAFAAVAVTAFAMMATEKPAEQPPAATEVRTVVLKPTDASGFIVGRVEPARPEADKVRAIRVTGANGARPVLYINGVRMEGTTREALQGIDPANIDFVDVIRQGVGQDGEIRIRTKAGTQDGKDGNDR